MKKNIMILSLIALTSITMINAGEINDDFGLETIEGETAEGYVFIHNNNKNNVWAALITDGKLAAQPIAIPAKPTLTKPGASALVNLPIANAAAKHMLAIWNTKPRNNVTVAPGKMFGFTITPNPDVTYRFTLPKGEKHISLELTNGKISIQ